MNVDDILEQIKSIHAIPIPCKPPLKDVEIEFDGTVEEFLAFIEQHCRKPVAVWRYVFDEDGFLTEIKADSAPSAESDFIDARTIDSGLRRFEQYLTTGVGYRLMAWLKDTDATIGFRKIDPWYDEFVDAREAAEKAYLAKRDETISKERDAKGKAEQGLMEKLNALVNDPAFCALKTHRAMFTYAIEKIEGLSELREVKVRQAIALLADKLGLKKH